MCNKLSTTIRNQLLQETTCSKHSAQGVYGCFSSCTGHVQHLQPFGLCWLPGKIHLGTGCSSPQALLATDGVAISQGFSVVLGALPWRVWQISQLLTNCSMSVSSVGHQTCKNTNTFIRTIPGWFKCSSANTNSWYFAGITTCVPLNKYTWYHIGRVTVR